MKLALILLVGISTICFAQNANPNYNKELAESLNGDEYGMKSYSLVILKTGEKKPDGSKEEAVAFQGHFKNMNRLVEENLLVVSGPFGKNSNDFRGLFILNISDLEEATKALNTDPAIAAGYLSFEIYPWYGSAAIETYLENHDKIWTKAE